MGEQRAPSAYMCTGISRVFQIHLLGGCTTKVYASQEFGSKEAASNSQEAGSTPDCYTAPFSVPGT